MTVIRDKDNNVLIGTKGKSLARTILLAVKKGISLEGAQLPDADLAGAKLWADVIVGYEGGYPVRASAYVNLQNANLIGANFAGADVRGGNFEGSNMEGANFTNAVCGANYTGANLREARFDGACLAGARFIRAALQNATLCNARAKGADFSEALLVSADLSGTELRLADFRRAVLNSGAKLVGANLNMANFGAAWVVDVDFWNANLPYVQNYESLTCCNKNILLHCPIGQNRDALIAVRGPDGPKIGYGAFWGTAEEFERAINEKQEGGRCRIPRNQRGLFNSALQSIRLWGALPRDK